MKNTGTASSSKSAAPAQQNGNDGSTGARGWWIAALVLLAVGLALCGELIRLHIKAAVDAAYHSYCSVNEAVSCDTVARSKYAVLFGVPLAVWGLFGYGLMTVVAGFGLKWRSSAAAVLFAGLAFFSLFASVVLAGISHFAIHAWCLVCIGTYAVNLALAVLSIFILRKGGVRAGFRTLIMVVSQKPLHSLASAGAVGIVALGLILAYPPPAPAPSLLAPPPSSSKSATSDQGTVPPPAAKDDAIPPLPPGIKVETGVTDEGLPWMGAAKPLVTITEFFDYECPHCRQASAILHRLVIANADRLQLVVRHFPLNSDCNRFISRPIYLNSCTNAKLANCAGEQNSFWKAHEYLFEHGIQNIEPAEFARALELNSQKIEECMKRDNEALNRDIEAGIALDIHGTPVFVVDGNVYLQYLPNYLHSILRPPAPLP